MFRMAVMRSLTGAAVVAAGCSFGMMDSNLATQLLSVSPSGGATGVAASSDVVLSFSRPMMAGMEQYLALHQDRITSPTMPMNCAWSADRMTLTCHPDQPLAPATRYAVHMGGGMMDAEGRGAGMGRYGMGRGGRWATGGMMSGQTGMMGTGWACGNGSYGMVFEFTTQ